MEIKNSIAFYIGSLARGGAERVIVNLAAYFKSEGYQVTIVTKLQEEDEYEIAEGIPRLLADIEGDEISKSRIKNLYRRIKKLRNIWKEIQPDYIVSFIKKNNFMAITSSMGLHIPVVVSVRSDPAREYPDFVTRTLAGMLFKRAKGIVLQTQDALLFFNKSIQKKAIVLPNSLTPAFLRPPYEGERKKEIVWVGRMDENKNPTLLFYAFAEVAKEFPDWTLHFCGEGREELKIKELCHQYHLEERVFTEGRIEQVDKRIETSSVFVLTSKQEGMPNALMEAMALGLAVISTDCPCGGPRELIEHGKNGLLIPVDDKETLVKELREVLKNTEYRRSLGEEAAKIQEKLNPTVVNKMWKDYITSK